MSDLIDRQDAIDVLEILSDKMSEEGKTVMAQAVAVLKDLQSAEGEWIMIPAFENMRCNNCRTVYGDNLYPRNFCPHCGAEMTR